MRQRRIENRERRGGDEGGRRDVGDVGLREQDEDETGVWRRWKRRVGRRDGGRAGREGIWARG